MSQGHLVVYCTFWAKTVKAWLDAFSDQSSLMDAAQRAHSGRKHGPAACFDRRPEHVIDSRAVLAGAAPEICEGLEAQGFAHQDAARAVRACGASPSKTTALDWLLLHLKADRLPESFAPGAFPHAIHGFLGANVTALPDDSRLRSASKLPEPI